MSFNKRATNGHERQLKSGQSLGLQQGERRINVQPLSGGMSEFRVWCQKQLIGFSLHSDQSTVPPTEQKLQRRQMNQQMNEINGV